MGLLTAMTVKTAKEAGKYHDGDGLYFVITPRGARCWVLRYSVNNRRREMGLGSADHLTLAEARDVAIDARRQAVKGIDPIEDRNQGKAKAISKAANRVTFEECAMTYMKVQRVAWTNDRHAMIWDSTLRTYTFPIFGSVPVKDISREHILAAMTPIWATKTETARRLLNRIERVLGYATVMGYRTGDNPARWRDNIDHVLPNPNKIRDVSHHPAMKLEDLPGFFQGLDLSETTHCGLAFLILTATRTSETMGARWQEVDFREKVWTIPRERTKASREHRIPLTASALEVLSRMRSISQNQFIFPGRIGGRHISNLAFLMIMRRKGFSEVPHGFRSTFKDWASECTNFPNEVSEMALAHVIGNKTEAAYRRGDLFEKRRELMNAWADFCGTKPTA